MQYLNRIDRGGEWRNIERECIKCKGIGKYFRKQREGDCKTDKIVNIIERDLVSESEVIIIIQILKITITGKAEVIIVQNSIIKHHIILKV